jgi:superfamily II DNA or RNA helicase
MWVELKTVGPDGGAPGLSRNPRTASIFAPDMQSPEKRVYELLLSLLSPDELRRILTHEYGYLVAAALPSEGPVSALFFSATEELRRRGLFGSHLFEVLVRHAPARRAEIAEIAASCGVAASNICADTLCKDEGSVALPAGENQTTDYFASIRSKINRKTLRECQIQASEALSEFFGAGGHDAAMVMAVGAGKTVLGVLACLSFARRRAMIITPSSVIRGTFDRALDHRHPQNVLYGLPEGALIPGCPPPKVRVLDRSDGPIRGVRRDELLSADILVTNFHSLGTGQDQDDLLAKLRPEDIDFIVVDEAHIAAADSYQRTFRHFGVARTVLMSACLHRLDGRPIDAKVVYRYRLVDSIIDGNAKQLRVRRFAPRAEITQYEIVWPDGSHEQIVGRAALLEVIGDERKLARITAVSIEPIRQVMQAVRGALERQARSLKSIKPRVLFSALGLRHAQQIAEIADDCGIPSAYLHNSMSERLVRETRARFESEAGDLQGIVQLRMLGQGYDFPPICVVVPMRPYGSFSEFYQFIGRGIRVIRHASPHPRVPPEEQWLDIVHHAELGLDVHLDTLYAENDMGGEAEGTSYAKWSENRGAGDENDESTDVLASPTAFVMFERGNIEQRVVHDEVRVQARKDEREREALARKYSEYAQSTSAPVTFEQYIAVMRRLSQ